MNSEDIMFETTDFLRNDHQPNFRTTFWTAVTLDGNEPILVARIKGDEITPPRDVLLADLSSAFHVLADKEFGDVHRVFRVTREPMDGEMGWILEPVVKAEIYMSTLVSDWYSIQLSTASGNQFWLPPRSDEEIQELTEGERIWELSSTTPPSEFQQS